MNQKATSPRHWQRWLDETGVGEAIDRHLGQYYHDALAYLAAASEILRRHGKHEQPATGTLNSAPASD